MPWGGEITPGTFFHEDLKALRRDLLGNDICESFAQEHGRIQPADGQVRRLPTMCHMRRPSERKLLQEWLKSLPTQAAYRGQRLASLALEILLALLKADRISPTAEDQKRIVADQREICRMCGSFLGNDPEFDRMAPKKQIFWGTPPALPGLVCRAIPLKALN